MKLLDGLAERWLCYRHHWSLAIFRGGLVGRRRYTRYRALNSQPLIFQIKPKVEVLRVESWGRFGNAVLQLRNVIYLAERLGVRTIEFSRKHPFFSGEHAGHIALAWGAGQPTPAATIEGRFFHLNAFRLKVEAADAARIFTDHVRPMVAAELRIPDPRLRADDLVLHFRGGDVFMGEVNPNYGQPPVSYYLSAVEREQPARVWLVFEDRSNPCIDTTETALRKRGVDVILQSGCLADDLRVLMSARRIVAGRGTFVQMIGHLSSCLDKIYLFEERHIGSLCQLGVGVVNVSDKQGEFKATMLGRKWRNSVEQRALMMSYPADKLAFEPTSGRLARGGRSMAQTRHRQRKLLVRRRPRPSMQLSRRSFEPGFRPASGCGDGRR